jgi:hypothetical protein
MNRPSVRGTLQCLLAAPTSVFAQNLNMVVNGELSALIDTSKGLHAQPELSHHEERTAALLAEELRKAGYAVTEHVGTYPTPTGRRHSAWWRFCKMAPARDC